MAGGRTLWPLMALLAAAAASLGLACNGVGDAERTIVITLTTPTPTSIPTPTPALTPTPTATPTPSPDVCGVNPDPAPPSVLQVQEPQPREQVRNPFHVRGWGSEIRPEQRILVALVDAKGEPLPPLDVPPQRRELRIPPPGLTVTDFTFPFATDILVEGLGSATPFCIWVFLETTPEGIPKQVVQVPVIVTP